MRVGEQICELACRLAQDSGVTAKFVVLGTETLLRLARELHREGLSVDLPTELATPVGMLQVVYDNDPAQSERVYVTPSATYALCCVVRH